MSDPFTPEVSARICKHMNEDHADAILLYAKAFGQVSEATAAQLVQIDAVGMDLAVQKAEATEPVRILFDHELKDSEDAHQTLIAMVKQARTAG
jgi:putative heme iron utilization protein